MKKTTILFLLFSINNLFAQSIEFNKLNDTIIARYNRADYDGIYALGNENFRIAQGKEDLNYLLSSLFKQTGKIKETVLISTYEKGRSFKWVGENKNLRFDFITKSGTDINEFNISDFVEQPYQPAKKILSDNKLKTKMDSIVNSNALIYMLDPKSVGLSIGIYKNGKTYTYNYGEVEKGSNQLPNSKTFYGLGSITKSFVGILLAKAVIDKKLNLTDDIRKYLKGNYPNLEYNGKPIQLQHLANHSSGLPYWTITRPDSLDNLKPYNQHLFYEKFTLKDLQNDLHKIKLDTLSGIRYNYSGAGINTLIIILQNVYSKSFEQLVKEYFGKQFGMTDTKKTLSKAEIKRFITGYDERDFVVPFFVQNTAALGPELTSTIDDMLKYISYNVKEENKPLKLSHQKTLSLINDYGVGLCWMLNKNWQGDNYIFHNGQAWGCITTCTLYPKHQTGFVIFVNEKSSQERVGALERNLSEALNGK